MTYHSSEVVVCEGRLSLGATICTARALLAVVPVDRVELPIF